MAVKSDLNTNAQKPLQGVRILDFTQVLAGPYCTAILSDIGAEVIKVEPPGGDSYRGIGPFCEGESALFLLNNRNKKSIAIDLKSEQGRTLAVDLSGHCDVVVENFKPGVAERLGIGYSALSAQNPKLVYASVSGFGQSGEMSDRPAFDLIAQAMSGYMDVTGEQGAAPLKVGESIGDLSAGLFASWAILAALYARTQTGRGRYVDIAMFDCLFSMLPTAIAQWMFNGTEPKRVGNRHPLTTPFGVFKALDGSVVIAVITNEQFRNLCSALDSPEMADNPSFATDSLRTQNEPVLRAMIESKLANMQVKEVVERLVQAQVPSSPIWSVNEAIHSRQVFERSLLPRQKHPLLGDIPGLEQPVHFNNLPRGGHQPAPSLGQHSAQILSAVLGLDHGQVAQLFAQGVVSKASSS